MSGTTVLPATEALLEHTGFLKRLACSLVFDEGQAEDIVQDALIVALRSGPRHAGMLRAWLAGVTRNLAFKRLRGDGRRRHREQAVARGESIGATVDIVARIDLQHRVVDAVRALPEPYRSTVAYRYLEELAVREIAERMDVPRKTVETRLRRAIERLQHALDEHHGGNRREWCLGLATLVPFSKELPAAATGWSALTLTGAAMSAKVATLGITVAVAAGSFAAGWALRKPADEPGRTAQRAGNPAAHVSQADYDTVRAELESTRAKYDAAQEQLQELTAPTKSAPAGTTGPDGGTRFHYEQFKGALDSVDWKLAAESATAMPPLLAQLADGLWKGKALRSMGDVLGEIQRWNGPLMGATLRIQQAGVPGTGTNGVFTHPAVVVNLVHATLAKAGKPLTEAQVEELRLIGDRYVQRDAERLAAYPPDTIAMRKTFEETELKQSLFDAIDNLLTPAQRAVLHPESVRGYAALDLFSTGVIWAPLRRPVAFDTRDELIEKLTTLQLDTYGIDAGSRPVLRNLTADWVGKFSDAFLAVEHAYDTASPQPTETARVRECAKHLIALREGMIAQLPLSDRARQKVKDDVFVAIPFKNPAPKPDDG
ncbi:MAG: RNA polymerase sigma factor [Planctomycetota bacterium]|jgi:RNA polymerase sigma-70 factor (ECF subfamily)